MMSAIGAPGDGLSMHREAGERRAQADQQGLVDQQIAPLRAAAANRGRRLTALEARREPE